MLTSNLFRRNERLILQSRHVSQLPQQHDYPAYYWFYRFFFIARLYVFAGILAKNFDMWETSAASYIGLFRMMPIRKIRNPLSFYEAFQNLSIRIAENLQKKPYFYEYKFGKIKVKTLSTWVREHESDLEAQKRMETLWYGFFLKYYPNEPGILQMGDDIYDIPLWKADKYERFMSYIAYTQQAHHIQRKLRINAQMSYVRSLRHGKRKHMFIKLSMKYWW